MSNPLDILINASLNMSTINQQLNELKGKGLNLGVDQAGINNILKQVQQLQRQVETKLGGIKVIDAETAQKELNKVGTGVNDLSGNFRKLFTSVEDAKKYFQQLGQVKINTNFDPITKQLDNFTVQVTKANGEIAKLKLNMVSVDGLNNPHYEIGKMSGVDNSDQLLEQQLQLRQRINSQIDAQNQKEAEATRQLEQQIALYQREAQIKVTNLNTTYGENVDQNSIQSYLHSVNELNAQTPNVNNEMRSLNTNFREIQSEARASASSTMGFGEALKEAFSKFPIWIAASTAFFQSIRFVTDGIGYVYQLNQALTQISIVTGKNQQQVSALADQYNNLASTMGVTTQDVANASVEFYRQGLNQAQVLDHVKVATEYAKISNLDLNTSAEILTATTNSMNVTMTHAADVFAYLGDATATGADEIGIAFQKVGGTAGALNLNFEKVASWIAVISSKTRESADTIGESIKSILARFQSLKEKGFDSTDGTTVNQVAKSLNAVGIQLMTSQGQFRNIGTVMDELGKKWNTLNSRQKSYLATTLAGTYQQSRFLNLMDGYSQSVSLYQKALNAAGTTQQKFNLYQQGTEAHLAKLKDAWAEVWQNTFNSQGLQQGIDGLTSLATGIKNVTGTVGALPVVLGIATTALIAFNSSMRTSTLTTGSAFLTMLKGIPTGLRSMDSALAVTTLKTRLFTGVTDILTLSMKGLRIAAVTTFEFLGGALLPVAGIMALTYGIQKLTSYFSDLHQQQLQQQQQVDKLTNSYTKNASQINNYIAQYKQLSGEVIDSNGKVNQNNKNYQSYLAVQTKLGQLMPSLISYTDANGQAHLKSAKNIDTEVSSVKTLTEAKKQLNDVKVSDDITNYAKNLQKAVIVLQSAKQQYNSDVNPTSAGSDYKPTTFYDTISAPQKAGAKQQAQDYLDLANAQYQLQVALSQGVKYTQQQASAYLDASKAGKDLTSNDKNLINAFVEQNKSQLDLTHGQQNAIDSIDRLATKTADYGKVIASIRNLLGKSADLNFLGSYNESQDKTLTDLIKSYKDGSLTLDEFTKRLTANGFTAKDQAKILDDLSGATNKGTDATNKQIDATTELTKILKSASTVQDYISQQTIGYTAQEIDQQSQLIELYNTLSQVTNKNAQQMALYNEIKAKLIALFPEEYNGQKLSLTGMMDEVNARKVMSQAAVDSASNRMSAEEQVTYNLAKNLQKQEEIIKAMIKNYEALMMSAVTVDPKNGAVAMNGVAMHWYNEMKAAEQQLSTVSASYISTTAKLAKEMNYQVDFTTPEFPSPSSGSSKSGSGKSGTGKSGSGSSSSSAANNAQQQAQNLANSIVQIYKDMYQQEENIALASIQKQMDALDAQHQKVMDNLTAEDKAYQDSVNKKLALIDKQTAAQSYNDTLKQQQQTVQNDQNKINVLKLDNSPEGKAALAAAQQQLASDQKTLNSTVSQHTTDLRKQNLQDSLTAYQADIQAQQDAETTKYNNQKAALQKQQNDVKAYYDNLLNDQRKFNSITSQVLKGQFTSIKNDFSSFAAFIKKNMSEIGQSISNNLIDNMTNAEKQMGGITSKSSSKSTSHSSSPTTSSSSKNKYYTVQKGDTLSEIAQKEYGHSSYSYYDKIAKANGISTSSTLRVGERLLIPFKSGGYTGNDEGIAYLHQKELILNQNDTSNMLKMVNIVRDLVPKINFPDLTKLTNKIGNTIHMPITIQSINGTKEGAMDFFSIVQNELNKMGVNT